MKILRSTLLLAVVTVIGTTILIALGLWQWERKEWKAEIIQERTLAFQAPPLDIKRIDMRDPRAVSQLSFRRIHAEGQYQHGKQINLPQRFRHNILGQQILTPLMLEDGYMILVDRGFLPDYPQSLIIDSLDSSPVRITGLLRPLPPSNPWLYQTAKNWQILDAATIAEHMGSKDIPLYYIEVHCPEECPGPLQVNRLPPLPRDPHLYYALTWFSLAFAWLVIAGLLYRQSNR